MASNGEQTTKVSVAAAAVRFGTAAATRAGPHWRQAAGVPRPDTLTCAGLLHPNAAL